MIITTPLIELLTKLNSNWEQYQKRLCFDFSEEENCNIEAHPLSGELINLINGKGGSFPFFTDRHVIWCTLAPQPLLLQKQIEKLQAWILPSYGWQESGDGYKIPDTSRDTFQRVISKISPTNYFRWRCSIEQYSIVEHKLATFYQLEERRPERNRLRRPSLYELRTQFQSALLLGDRYLAEKAIELIDTYELDKALNTQLMRIRLWHHFREFENIRNCRNLPYLQTQPSLPNIINECIREALGEFQPEPVPIGEPEVIPIDIEDEWEQWFSLLIDQNDIESARNWLEEKDAISVEQLNQNQIEAYSERWDSLFVSNELKQQNRQLINEALVTFLGDFVREPDFPRRDFAELYSSLLRLWGEMNAGIGRGREEGHVLLELANALFELNHNIDEAKSIIEAWWKARPVPSQLPFALDAIELLAYQHPDSGAAGNLWIDAADLAKRNSQQLLESEKVLWRSTGSRIGLEEETIQEYFPIEKDVPPEDLLVNANLQKVAIVCMREQQARTAAEIIQDRTGANVSIVSAKVAGTDTDLALTCDVVLFVWIATSHAVFRAFDGFDRRKLCYVQGTGAASIVRALETWSRERS